MANYKLSNDNWETSGIYDLAQQKTQRQINADVKTAIETESVSDNAPYVFRKTGGGLTVGNRLKDMLVGGTIAWNQMVANGNFATNSGWSGRYCTVSISDNVATATVNSAGTERGMTQTTNDTKTIAGHKYLLSIWFNTSVATNLKLSINGASQVTVPVPSINTWTLCEAIWTYSSNTDTSKLAAYTASSVAASSTLKFKNAMSFDLTQMFGSTIADYIYSLETAHAGDGVAYFRSIFPKTYYAYNAGTLMSVNTSAHKTVGKNLCVKTVRGYFSGTANSVNVDGDSETFVFYAIKGMQYRASAGNITLNRSYLAMVESPNVVNNTPLLNTPINLGNYQTTWTAEWTGWTVWYLMSHIDTAVEAVAQVEFGSTATAYEPYEGHEYPLDSDLVLRGIPKLDANNKLYYDGDTYESDGSVTRKYGIVDLGTLYYNYSSSDTRFYTTQITDIKPVTSVSVVVNAKSVKYEATSYQNVHGSVQNDKVMGLFTSGTTNYFAIKDTAYTDSSAFRTSLSGVYLVYELATPTTETASPYTNPQICDGSGTEEYVDAGVVAEERDVSIPVGHNTEYMTETASNAAGWDTDYSTMIAPTEKDFTATRPYSANNLFIISNQIYKATTSIANGAAIVVGTNCTTTTIGELITALLNA